MLRAVSLEVSHLLLRSRQRPSQNTVQRQHDCISHLLCVGVFSNLHNKLFRAFEARERGDVQPHNKFLGGCVQIFSQADLISSITGCNAIPKLLISFHVFHSNIELFCLPAKLLHRWRHSHNLVRSIIHTLFSTRPLKKPQS